MPRFVVDTGHSTVDIGLRVNLYPSHLSATGIHGTAELELDEHGGVKLDRPFSAEVTLPVSALSSGFGLQDWEMRRRLEVARYPDISVRVIHGEEVDASDGRYRATALLTLHGQTREVTGTVRLARSGMTVEADAEAVINMRDFGIEPPQLLALRVEPEVDVRAHVVARPRP